MTSWNLCTSAAAIDKAGLNANSTIVASGVTLARWSEEAEGSLNAETRRDWISSAASTNYLGAIKDIVSSKIAQKMIAYDMSSYPLPGEANTLLDLNANIERKGIAVLKEFENQEKM